VITNHYAGYNTSLCITDHRSEQQSILHQLQRRYDGGGNNKRSAFVQPLKPTNLKTLIVRKEYRSWSSLLRDSLQSSM